MPTGEAKNLLPYLGPHKMRDCFCTINLDQEEVYRTQVVEKSLRLVEKLEIIHLMYIHGFMYFPDFYQQIEFLDIEANIFYLKVLYSIMNLFFSFIECKYLNRL